VCDRVDEFAVVVIIWKESAGGPQSWLDQWQVVAVEGLLLEKHEYKVALSDSHFDFMGVMCEERAHYLPFNDEADSNCSLVHWGKCS
jgi:hypothetical protein